MYYSNTPAMSQKMNVRADAMTPCGTHYIQATSISFPETLIWPARAFYELRVMPGTAGKPGDSSLA